MATVSKPQAGNVTIIDDGGKNLADFLIAQVNQLQTEFAALLALFNSHVHSGVTTGASNSAVPTSLASATQTGQITVKK